MSERTPKVTVLMPLYNGKKYIAESIESVQAQTFTDWEFIIVNGYGSDDGCVEIVRKYAENDKRIKLVQNEKRHDVASNLNIGLDMARGEYIARVDDDDPSEPERFEKQVAFMDSHQEVSLCSCLQNSLTKDISKIQKVASEPQDLKAEMMFGCQISHCGAMLRKKDFDAHGWRYNPDFLCEDFELWTRILKDGGALANLLEPLVIHRWGFGNVSLSHGKAFEQEAQLISKRSLDHIGVNTNKYFSELFSGWRATQKEFAKNKKTEFLKQGYDLLQEILEKNKISHYCDQVAMEKMVHKRWDWVRESCDLNFTKFAYGKFKDIKTTPVVSVVLPTYNSVERISSAIDSIISQTFTDWELLVVNDYYSDDGTIEIVKMYASNDSRIKLLQAQHDLGLAESLNWGMREARGKYIARADSDDISYTTRFEKQVAFLNEHADIGLVGTWLQNHGDYTNFVNETESDEKKLQASLIFKCDINQSTVMWRKALSEKENLFYRQAFESAHYDFFARASAFTKVANIPETLCVHEIGQNKEQGNSFDIHTKFTDATGERIFISRMLLKSTLGTKFVMEELETISIPNDTFSDNIKLEKLELFLRRIWSENENANFYDKQALLSAINEEWCLRKYGKDSHTKLTPALSIDAVFVDVKQQKTVAKRILSPFVRFSRKVTKALMRYVIDDLQNAMEWWTWNRYELTRNDIEGWTWERFQRTRNDINRISGSFNVLPDKMVPYYADTKIRVVFLCQVAAFWPAQELVYETLKKDSRFDVKLICCDEDIDGSVKVHSTRQYLEKNNYEYIHYTEFSLKDFNPHIVFFQTPYDGNKGTAFKSASIKKQGGRIIYIPYGIELPDTIHAHTDHFKTAGVNCAWKVYTFSEVMRQEYLQYCEKQIDVVATGLPRFDALYHKERFPQHEVVTQKANGRKIVLWKVHFPKVIPYFDKTLLVTPDIKEYIKFANEIEKHDDLFFVFMPHPRFEEFNDDQTVKKQTHQLMSILRTKNNVYIDAADDYRPSLLNAHAIMVDRSAVAVEAAVVGVPVLFMANDDYYEPFNKAVKPLFESYYQGTKCSDMENFIAHFKKSEDPKRAEREAAFRECIPYFDGKCAERIKEDIVQSINAEAVDKVLPQNIEQRVAQLEAQNTQILQNQEKILAHMERLLGGV